MSNFLDKKEEEMEKELMAIVKVIKNVNQVPSAIEDIKTLLSISALNTTNYILAMQYIKKLEEILVYEDKKIN